MMIISVIRLPNRKNTFTPQAEIPPNFNSLHPHFGQIFIICFFFIYPTYWQSNIWIINSVATNSFSTKTCLISWLWLLVALIYGYSEAIHKKNCHKNYINLRLAVLNLYRNLILILLQFKLEMNYLFENFYCYHIYNDIIR